MQRLSTSDNSKEKRKITLRNMIQDHPQMKVTLWHTHNSNSDLAKKKKRNRREANESKEVHWYEP